MKEQERSRMFDIWLPSFLKFTRESVGSTVKDEEKEYAMKSLSSVRTVIASDHKIELLEAMKSIPSFLFCGVEFQVDCVCGFSGDESLLSRICRVMKFVRVQLCRHFDHPSIFYRN